MSKFAVIATGGKQYKVSQGDLIEIEKIDAKEGDKIKFDTLLISDEVGKDIVIGEPVLNEQVEGKIVDQFRERKLTVQKFKAKIRYRRKLGHRQHKTKVEITKV